MARSGILYGSSGTRKTTAVKHFSHYIYEKTGRSTLLLSMDGGGWSPAQPEIMAGVILPYRVNAEVPLPILRWISKGYWPSDSGETEIAKTDLRKIDWTKFGGVAIEGVTSISQAIMRHLADKQIKTGEEATSPFSQRVLVDGVVQTETFAGNSRAHFGFVQQQLYSLVTNLIALPCEYVLFTGLESRTEDDDRTTIYGPQIAGKKATALIPSWVGDCIHAEGFPVSKQVEVPDPADVTGKLKISSTVVDTVVRFYFMQHPDPGTGIMFPAKPRITPEKLPDLMKKWPGGYFEPGLREGFDVYLKTLDDLDVNQADELIQWRKQQDEKRAARLAEQTARTATGAATSAGTATATTAK